MKTGDLVRVDFGRYWPAAIGLFVNYDEEPECSGRAYVFWDGEVRSTPIDQLEVINGT
tara:strand:- start:127 stop:300 length:174 start_codon:yes stop_codon:yes gene_type:complete